ncbi:hypothetical protein DRQ09_06600, partial [candidate division KSB1 bacterium]
ILSLGILAGAELLFNKKANDQDNYEKLTFQQLLKDNINGVDGLNGATSVILSLDNKNVCVTCYWDNAVAVFQ